MFRKNTIAVFLTLLLLASVSTIALASGARQPVYQTGMDMGTATALPADQMVPEVMPIIETPMPGTMYGGTGMNQNGMAMGGCPMMNGMTDMSTMGSMTGMTGMNSMGSMGSMSGMTTMNGMSEMGEFDLRSALSNPWYLLGWVLLGLVLLAGIGAVTFGTLWIVRRSKPVRAE